MVYLTPLILNCLYQPKISFFFFPEIFCFLYLHLIGCLIYNQNKTTPNSSYQLFLVVWTITAGYIQTSVFTPQYLHIQRGHQYNVTKSLNQMKYKQQTISVLLFHGTQFQIQQILTTSSSSYDALNWNPKHLQMDRRNVNWYKNNNNCIHKQNCFRIKTSQRVIYTPADWKYLTYL